MKVSSGGKRFGGPERYLLKNNVSITGEGTLTAHGNHGIYVGNDTNNRSGVPFCGAPLLFCLKLRFVYHVCHNLA